MVVSLSVLLIAPPWMSSRTAGAQSPAAQPQLPAAQPQSPEAPPGTPMAQPQTPTAQPQLPAAQPQTPAAPPQAPAAQPRTPADTQVNAVGSPAGHTARASAEAPPKVVLGAERPPPKAAEGAAEQEEPRGEPRLTHFFMTVGVGVPLRVSQDEDFGQDTFAPVFFDGLVGIAFPVGARVQHGLGLGASIGMTADGGFYEPTPAGSQLALMPAYLAYAALDPDLFTAAHLGVPILLAGGTSVGFDLGATLGYRMLSGFGAYTELSLGGFAGARGSINLTTSLEAGLFIDYEVLP